MTGEKKNSECVAFARRHGEKLGLALALAALGAWLAAGVGMAAPDPDAQSVAELSRGVAEEMDRAHADRLPPAERPVRMSAPVITAAAPPAGAAILPVKEVQPPPPPPPPPKPVSPTPLVTIEHVSLDGVSLSWTLGAGEAKIDHFLVERNGVALAKPDAKARAYVDRTVEPRTFYAYRVTAVPARKDVELARSEGAVAKTPSRFTVSLFQVSRSEVWFTVEKVDPKHGRVSERFHLAIGEKIGGERTLRLNDRWPKIDFATGWTLRAVEECRKVDRLSCETVFGPTGVPAGCIQRVTDHPFQAWKVTLADDEGAERVLWTRAPKTIDDRCKEHRGK